MRIQQQKRWDNVWGCKVADVLAIFYVFLVIPPFLHPNKAVQNDGTSSTGYFGGLSVSQVGNPAKTRIRHVNDAKRIVRVGQVNT